MGQSFGAFLGYAVFLNLASPSFSNSYLRSAANQNDTVGVVTLASFLFGWSLLYFLATTLILVLKKEGDGEIDQDDEEGQESEGGKKNSILSSYLRLWFIVKKLPSVRKCILFYFTSHVSFLKIPKVFKS